MDYHQPLFPEGVYHVLSRANGSELLFRNEDNYHFFLHRYRKYIYPIGRTLAWALLPNHFHFLIRIRDTDELLRYYLTAKGKYPEETEWAPELIMQQFSNFLNSYAKSYNKQFDRKGALFIDYVRRVPVVTDEQLLNTTSYIHNNAVKHRLCERIDQWRWTSYHEYVSTRGFDLADKQEIMRHFPDLGSFIRFHQQVTNL